MKALLRDCITLPQQCSAPTFGKLHNAKQGQDPSMTLIVTCITGLVCETDVSDVTKRMFLLTKLLLEMHNMKPRGVTYEAFEAMVNGAIQAKIDLQFEAECVSTWSKKDKTVKKSVAKQEQ